MRLARLLSSCAALVAVVGACGAPVDGSPEPTLVDPPTRMLVAVRLTAALVVLFLANEIALAVWPSLLYPIVRMAVIPLAAAVCFVASAVGLVRSRGDRRAQTAAALSILVAGLVWAFQWLAHGALFLGGG